MSDVFVVLSMDMGNVPLCVYDNLEAAERHAATIFAVSGNHACVAKFQMNAPSRAGVLDNVYDTTSVTEGLFKRLKAEFVTERKARFVGDAEFQRWFTGVERQADLTFRDIVKIYIGTGETTDITEIDYEAEYEMAGLNVV